MQVQAEFGPNPRQLACPVWLPALRGCMCYMPVNQSSSLPPPFPSSLALARDVGPQSAQLFVFSFLQHVLALFLHFGGPSNPQLSSFRFRVLETQANKHPYAARRLHTLRLIRLDEPGVCERRDCQDLPPLPARFQRHWPKSSPVTPKTQPRLAQGGNTCCPEPSHIPGALIIQLLSNRILPSPHPKRGQLHIPSYNRPSSARIHPWVSMIALTAGRSTSATPQLGG